MANKDYYEILGVSKNADTKTIKTAYRKLAMQHHPDKTQDPSSDQKMREINEAYETLSDEKKRKDYDMFGSGGPNAGAHNGYSQGGNPFSGFAGGFSGNPFGGGSGGFSDFFEDIFNFTSGGGRSQQEANNSSNNGPQDYQITRMIPFTDAIVGAVYKESFEKYEPCLHCKGTGAESSSDLVNCSTCIGKGYVNVVKRSFFGDVASREMCPKCSGTGKIVVRKCKSCDGEKFIKSTKKMSITIPAGVISNTNLKLSGFGGPGANGQVGDLYIRIMVKEHKYFKREGNDIHLELPISFIDVINERIIDVPTPYGLDKIKLKKTYNDTMTIKLVGKGVKTSKGTGDLRLKLRIIIPPNLSPIDYDNLIKSSMGARDNSNKEFVSKVKKER
ncbi:DnaJ C-terminal domain-containing protein [Mycoplasma crocodyli]|uniref:Chaperone protein DnaJ n=1 Tax=Mycoplasma crocodyli (strain ATCC 51981 / MP145) TaxID=512564 RepID=D5E4M0_MYCCM|nr:DnaJ C-terminal domain-containing protein [Mycoplasma crocodyli]ADE19519.1 chaperone protein DnaJ [Mycoplasma crocodyli MP145]